MTALCGIAQYILNITNYVKAVLSVGKALGAFWPGRGTGRETAGWVGDVRCAAGSLCAQTVPTSFGNLL